MKKPVLFNRIQVDSDFLLFGLLKRLEESFLTDGGLRENMTKCRLEQRRDKK